MERWFFTLCRPGCSEKVKAFSIRLFYIQGVASDGDPRLLKAMMLTAQLGEKPVNSLPNGWGNFFVATYRPQLVNMQDGEHICVKLIRRLFKTLVIGSKTASINFFLLILQNFPKSRHMLTKSDFLSKDKMAFGTVEKLCKQEVFDCLTEVADCQGIIMYLQLIKRVKRAFVETGTTAGERIKDAWYSIFFLRFWRQFIHDEPQLIGGQYVSEAKHFITTNTYNGIELNGHSLVSILTYCREKNCPDLFFPALMTSQPCEKFFRRTRSMTSTFSTIINYTMFDLLHKAKRSLAISTIMNEIDDYAFFPRKEKKTEQNISTVLPDEVEVFKIISTALAEARDDFLSLGN